MDAYDTIDKIDNNLELQNRFFFFIDKKGKEIKEIKNTAFNSLVSAIYSDFGSRVNLEMNKENYDFINNQIISVYDKIPNENKKQYNDVTNYKNTLDIKRDDYLKKLMGKISNTSNPDEARKKLNNVYHNSNEEFGRKKLIGWIPVLGKLSYKEYWEKVKNDYLKELNKK